MENIFFDDFSLFQICNPITVKNQEHRLAVSIGNQGLIYTVESQEHLLNVLKENWKRDKQLCTIIMLCYTVHMLYLLKVMAKKVEKPIRDHIIGREQIRTTLLQQLCETNRCRDILRMGPHAFLELCTKLRATGHVKDTIHVTVEEQVARFLYIIAHNVKNRTISFFFHRSGETISRNFHAVLRAVISLEEEFLQQPSGTTIPSEILHSNRFYPYFKNCIGAIDGTHVRVKVPIADQPRFRGRKEWPTQNILDACGFDIKFTYALAGWEGTEIQVLIAEEHIQVAKIQAQAVERGITFLEQSRTRVYSENDVYNELKKLGVVKEIFWSCYRFFCRDERAKREFFGVPFEDRHGALYDLMKEAGAI